MRGLYTGILHDSFKLDTKILKLILTFKSGSEQIIHLHIYSSFLAYRN